MSEKSKLAVELFLDDLVYRVHLKVQIADFRPLIASGYLEKEHSFETKRKMKGEDFKKLELLDLKEKTPAKDLVEKILSIKGVDRVTIKPYSIKVRKNRFRPWDDLEPSIIDAIEEIVPPHSFELYTKGPASQIEGSFPDLTKPQKGLAHPS